MPQPQHIRYYDLATLKRWNRNYRQGDVGAIIQSIARFGFNGALRVWRDDVVIAGNHALMALLQMKASAYQTPRGIVEHDGKWLIPCVDVSHLSEIEAEAYAIADNRTQERGDNDNEQLAALLASIAAEDAALLAATGYDGDDVDNLLRILAYATLGGNGGQGPNDPYAEWGGMPEYDQENLDAAYSIRVNFNTLNDLQSFSETTGLSITEQTKSVWFPYRVERPHHGKAYVE